MAEDIVIRLDRETAVDLAGMIHDVGEHLAAGAPIAPMTTGESERLGRLLGELRRRLDRQPDANV